MLPGSQTEGILASFSPDASQLAIAIADGSIRIFDSVGERKESVINESKSIQVAGGLTEQYTSLIWARRPKEEGKKKKDKGARGNNMVIVGSASGTVRAFDTASLTQVWAAQGCHEGGVTGLSYDLDTGVLSCGADSHLCVLDPADGHVKARFQAGKGALAAVAAAGAGRAVAATSAVALYDVTKGERVRKFPGHPGPVRAAAVTVSASHALSAGRGERQVAVWALSDKKRKTAAALLSVDDPVTQLAVREAAGGEGQLYAAVVTETGEAALFRLSPSEDGGDGAMEGERLATVRVGKGAARGAKAGAAEPVLAVRLEEETVLLAYGSALAPRFHRIDYPTEASEEPISLAPAGGSAGAAVPSGAAAKAAKAAARQVAGGEVLGAENGGEAVTVRPVPGVKRGRAEAAEGGAADDLGGDSSAEEEGEEGPTLEERVAALSGLGDDRAGAQPGAAGPAGPSLGEGPVKADSLAVLLTQALRSEDRALLERCLSVGSDRIINNTVRRLLPADAAAFLRTAVDRLQSRPARGSQLSTWIRAVLVHHAGYLMAAPGLQPHLTALYQAIEARLAVQRPLLSLAGRLDLLSGQLRSAAGGAAGEEGDEEGDGLAGPAVVYEEPSDDEDGVAVEDPFLAGGGSDGESESDEGEGSEDEDDEGGMSGSEGSEGGSDEDAEMGSDDEEDD